MADASLWATSLLAVAFRCIFCGYFFFPHSYIALWDSKTPHKPNSEGVSWCLETSPPSQLPPRDGSPSLTLLSLFLSFVFCPSPFEENGLPFWVSGVLHQRSEVGGSCSAFKWSFDEFVGEKVVSPSYSSAILRPSPVKSICLHIVSVCFHMIMEKLSGCNRNHMAHCCHSVTQSCQALCDSMDCSTPGFPILHYLPEFSQTHVHSVSDAIQPSHTLLSPSLPAFNLSWHQGLFQWVGSSHQVDKILQLQHQSFQWIFRVDLP